ncbi:CLAVATA3/ESR (CLE)-related protein TDIF [Ricinus communis]|uniref:Uncharacterized protein n=1 Tax=Ricinus communis TaxID=3988 RepID=B9RWJ5_RICCO|nr:CLAVATA3/ESR (CLE)-related protein TDIF [Ricinus communis]EEF44247.1 conserved hypothetical protein [Ricinus communis]|eukprot:XP_002518114.1 CLAVATA3/ESR (CLE)-related protein TDIF [Ricinus communis]
MDIDPFWSTGGWFIEITGSTFMAPAVPETSSSTRSQATLLFLGLFLFLVVPLLARPLDFPKRFMASTAELHPQQTKHTHPSSAAAVSTATISGSSSGQQFKAAAHEVPSGPNPESN